MSLTGKLELISGIGIALFASFNCFHSFEESNRARLVIWDYLFILFIWIVFPLLVVVGSYIHTIKQRFWGFVMLSIGSLFLTLAFLSIIFIIGASWYIPNWIAILSILPSIMAIVTVLFASANFRKKLTAKEV
ncbi:MAG: hypothetical protein LC768_10415 [Acidobacteria bacterium]|nr:hypothetical protein [Acidobacteriota bacterium]MCA1638728.1 hypothetical protein [Acidobacteriota bacterium]